jgi:stress-induced morphogen
MEFVLELKKKINKEINPEEILIVDNSILHRKHKSFVNKKFYLKLIITSNKLKNMRKIDAHKLIFSLLKNEMKTHIHALEIVIN